MLEYLEKNKKLSVVLTVIIAIEIFAVSSIPGSNIVTRGFDLSLLYHLLAFFLLNFFFILSISKKNSLNVQYIILSIFFSIVYAVLDEMHQVFVPLRFPSLTDVLVDIVGILWSAIVYVYYKTRALQKSIDRD